MRILLLNPNTSEALTERMVDAARTTGTSAKLIPVTATRGFPYISSRAEAALAATFVLELIAEHPDVDAVVIAAFGDPGLVAARELYDVPIVGMADAAMLAACALGERFAIVTFAKTLAPWFRNSVARAGLGGRFAGVFVPPETFTNINTVQDDLSGPLTRLCHDAASAGADAVVLSGAPLAGLAQKIGDRLPIPAIDPISAAVLQAEMLVRLGVRPAQVGGFARPPSKPCLGLAPALTRRIAYQGSEEGG